MHPREQQVEHWFLEDRLSDRPKELNQRPFACISDRPLMRSERATSCAKSPMGRGPRDTNLRSGGLRGVELKEGSKKRGPNGVLRLLETRCLPPSERERHDARLPQKFGTESIVRCPVTRTSAAQVVRITYCSERLASNSLNRAVAHAECLLSENSKSEINTVDSSTSNTRCVESALSSTEARKDETGGFWRVVSRIRCREFSRAHARSLGRSSGGESGPLSLAIRDAVQRIDGTNSRDS
ncbi:hypothetical protein B0H14DRAFT_2564044 [Mycena olivaceomarginata]|nr:hypothetical protein B0H14DRAFT_2564044 [Mycena olivaceomarginata]